VEIAVLDLWVWEYAAYINGLQAKLRGRAGTRTLSLRITPTPPSDKDAADPEQRRRVFDDHGKRRQRASHDKIVRADSLPPLLDASGDHTRAGHTGDRHGALQVCRTACI
jgi:hypothetical protein